MGGITAVLVRRKRNIITTVMGRKGSGKSTMIKEIIESDQFPRVFVLDTNGEYGVDENGKTLPGWTITDSVKAGAAAMLRLRHKDEFKLAMRDEDTESLSKLLEIVFEIPDCLIVVEETHFYVKSSHLPIEFSKLVRMGRHKAISQIYVSQRPSGLNRDMTAQSDFIVTFRQQEQRDIKWLSEVAGEDGAEDVRNLPDYKVRVWVLGDESQMPLPIVARIHEKKSDQMEIFVDNAEDENIT